MDKQQMANWIAENRLEFHPGASYENRLFLSSQFWRDLFEIMGVLVERLPDDPVDKIEERMVDSPH